MLPDLERLRQSVRERLSPKRYRHSVAVQKRAAHLAQLYGADWYRAAVAGLLHDICHDLDRDAQLNYMRAHDILCDTATMENPPIWHAITGACFAREALGIRDEEILSAIRYHTTGRAEMTQLEKVVYVADLTSEDRTFPDIAYVRALSERSLEQALFYSLRHTMKKLIRNGKPLVRDAWEAYNYYQFITKEGLE